MSSFYYIQPDLKNDTNASFLNALEIFSNKKQMQVYAIKNPLGENKYNYERDDILVLLSPGYKITFVSFNVDEEEFNDFQEDFVEVM
ncbi:hypothetical protein [Klebsiella variicola]|uniref:hypothetical protein n=1 Tax=Klebsiella variicola TaxID=244366 RepID=UPI0035A224C4